MAKKAKKPASRKMRVLPRKPSALIKIALADIRKAEKMPSKFVIDMETYFQPQCNLVCRVGNMMVSEKKVCVMCAAGSVMAFTLGKANHKSMLTPSDFGNNSNQLAAINCLREGEAQNAGHYLGIEIPNLLDDDIPEYSIQNPEPFHKAMIKFGEKLKKAGF